MKYIDILSWTVTSKWLVDCPLYNTPCLLPMVANMGDKTLDSFQSSQAESFQLSLRGPDLLNLTPITRDELPDHLEVPAPVLIPSASTPITSPPPTSLTLQTAAPLITNTGLLSVDTVIIKEQDTLMSYTERPTVTLEHVAFAEVAAQPLQQVQSPVKDEQDKNGYTS